MKRILFLIVSCSLFLTSCASTQDIVPADYKLPEFKEIQLDNGLRILFLEDPEIPFLSLGLSIPKGYIYDPVGKSGLSQIAVAMLRKGTKQRNATQIAEDLDYLGLDFSSAIDLELSTFSINGLSKFEGEILNNYKEMIFEPAFAKDEVTRIKKQVVAGLKKIGDDPSSLADLYSKEFLFGNHPMARIGAGKIRDVQSIDPKDVKEQYKKLLTPKDAVLTVVGRYSSDFQQKIIKEFSAWKAEEPTAPVLPSIEPAKHLQIRLHTKESLKQTQVRFVDLGPKRDIKDYLAIRIANTILGGNFAARLMQEVRVKRGLTYGIYSGFDHNLENGSFQIRSFTRNDKVGELVTSTLNVFKEFVENGLTEEELRKGKNVLLSNYPNAIETKAKLAGNLAGLRFYGISDDYLYDFVDNVESISLSEVNKAIKKYMHPDHLKILVLGPSKVRDQLKDVGILEVRASRM
ncbi:MAG: hypothetical protein CL674_05915 [Bdellovibrionaceae bacterium]|nr:hypothetical protein [Pseudobdellovibrionaceae bacterium]|tara:strand:- start:112 stop:1494 length:1383 start_codon:yes stop_codon:yes gene_type:complete